MNESIIEKYRREMMEMHRRASVPPADEEPLPDWSEADLEEKEESVPDFSVEEYTEQPIEPEPEPEPQDTAEHLTHEEKVQTDEPSVCTLCEGRIALCGFKVENAENHEPIEHAQIMLHRENGLFVRMLTNEWGETQQLPLFCDSQWRISVTAQGYISVSSAAIMPAAGEKLTIPVQLDESLSLSDIFSEHDGSIIGA